MQYPAVGAVSLDAVVAGGTVGGIDGYGGGIAGVYTTTFEGEPVKALAAEDVVFGQMDAAYIAQMEHILDVYAEPSCPERPLVNVDEAGKQLVGEVQAGRPMTPGQVSKVDYEYERKGVANIYLCV